MEPKELQLPAVFGRYLLLRRLSRGGMGEIYLAKAGDVKGLEKLFIIKKILPHLSNDKNFVRRFTEEAQLAIKLSHINVAPVFEVGTMKGELFLALEYVEGRDLRRILSRCYELGIRVPQDLALFIAKEVANGLAYAHRRTDENGRPLEIVHCDISPPNILVSYEGEVKIIDFGVARSAFQVQDVEPTTGFGKLGYMAPEQLLKGRKVDQRTDLYSLGVMLYESLVGDRMIDLDVDADHRLNVRKIVLDPVIPPTQRVRGLDPRLDPLLLKAVAKDPKDRFQDATGFRKQIQMILAEINPTLSAEDLGHFVKETFIDEQEQERDLLQEAHAMNLAPYMEQLHVAGEATVSYAMTDMWEISGRQPPAPSPKDASTSATGLPAPSEVPAPPRESGVAAQVISDPLLLEMAQKKGKKGWIWGAVAGAVFLVMVGVAVAWVWTADEEDAPPTAVARDEPHQTTRVASASADEIRDGAPATSPHDGAVTRAMHRVQVARRDVRRITTSRKRGVRRVGRRVHVHRRHNRPTRRRTAMKPANGADGQNGNAAGDAKVDASEAKRVERKYRRVRSQYKKFRAQYGQRLEKKWQAILRTAVYSGSNKYRRLDSMLDGLKRRMSAIRKKEGR